MWRIVAWQSFSVGNSFRGTFRRTLSTSTRRPRLDARSSLSLQADENSAISKSRQPFQSPERLKATAAGDWKSLGLNDVSLRALIELQLPTPTSVQAQVIPKLLKHNNSSLAFVAATGTGKTLAYALPLLQLIKETETLSRPVQRPRLLILAPTRELVLQIRSVVKSLCHILKLSSAAVYGGEDYGKQRQALAKPLDVLVATPGRVLKHWKDQNVFLGRLEYVVLDEMDTLVEQGFASELQQLLHPLLYHKQGPNVDHVRDLHAKAPRIVLTSATLTQAVQKMIGDSDAVQAKKHFRKEGATDGAKLVLPPMPVVKVAGLHRTVQSLKQVFVDTGSVDKMSLIVDIVASGGSGAAIATDRNSADALTMIFCNTAAACRAVQFALAEANIETLAYHGELNSVTRLENLQCFRQAGMDGSSSDTARVLVCTDLAARGLDIPQVDHVVMFDFPLNALDYLHRSGRTARGVVDGRSGNGRVTALVTRRDKVLANAIEKAVQRGEPLDGLSSRRSDYQPGGRLGTTTTSNNKSGSLAKGTTRKTSMPGRTLPVGKSSKLSNKRGQGGGRRTARSR